MKNRFLKGNKFRKEELLKKAIATGALSAMILGIPVLASANEENNADASNTAESTEIIREATSTQEDAPKADPDVFTYSVQEETSSTTTSDTVTTTGDSVEVETPTESEDGESQIPDGNDEIKNAFKIFKNTPIVGFKESLQNGDFKGQEVKVFDKDGNEITDPNAIILEGYTLIIGDNKFKVLINEEFEYRPEGIPVSFVFSRDYTIEELLKMLYKYEGKIILKDSEGKIVTSANSIKDLTIYIDGYKVDFRIDPEYFNKPKEEQSSEKQPQTTESAVESVRDQLKDLSASEGAKVVAKAVKETITSADDAVKVIAEAKVDKLTAESSKEEIAETLGKVSAAVSKLVELGNSEQAVETLADIVTKLDGKVDIESLKVLLSDSLSNKDLLKSLSAKLGNVSKELSDLIAKLLAE